MYMHVDSSSIYRLTRKITIINIKIKLYYKNYIYNFASSTRTSTDVDAYAYGESIRAIGSGMSVRCMHVHAYEYIYDACHGHDRYISRYRSIYIDVMHMISIDRSRCIRTCHDEDAYVHAASARAPRTYSCRIDHVASCRA